MHACICVNAFVLQPERQEDGTVTGKDRWREILLSAMGAGKLVTLPLLPHFILFLPFFLFSPYPLPPYPCFPSPHFSFSAGCSLSVLLSLSHPLASTVSVIQVLCFCIFLCLFFYVNINRWWSRRQTKSLEFSQGLCAHISVCGIYMFVFYL